MYEPAGLSSPAILAFFISISDMSFLYSDNSFILLFESDFPKIPSNCLSSSCISAEYVSV